MFRRIGIALVAAASALTGSAQAYPSVPILRPLPAYTCGALTASWSESRPDLGGRIVNYRVVVSDPSAGTVAEMSVPGLSATFTDLPNNREYRINVYALELRVGVLNYSDSSSRLFTKNCVQIPSELLKQRAPRLGLGQPPASGSDQLVHLLRPV